uniref:hypothetical protein n=1 Tax=Fodinicola feengrottensis TaxID=435914 RepID=UPI002442FDB3|nr:hypothetical protein [Fodinicola feengrottensis]
MAAGLAAGTYRQSRDEVLSEVARITRASRIDRVLSTRLTGTPPSGMRLEWRVDEGARARLAQEVFGKQLLVTDHDDWSVADVVTAYRARYHLDSTFRQLSERTVCRRAGGRRLAVVLDRSSNSRLWARLCHCGHGDPSDAAGGRPGRAGPFGAGTAGAPVRNSGDNVALSVHRRPATDPPGAHRPRSSPAAAF